MSLFQALLRSGYEGSGECSRHVISNGPERVPILLSGTSQYKQILLLSPGFGSRFTDYEPLARLFEQHFLLVRVYHSGSGRWAAMLAAFCLLANRACGKSGTQAARAARTWIHRLENRNRRLGQFKAVARFLSHKYPDHQLSVAGHSFGTDTVLNYCLQEQVQQLYLFSPHPPAYLIESEAYARLRARGIWVITGTKDFTRDGVGPQERSQVASVLDPGKLRQLIVLDGLAHMDPAFPGLGPGGWEQVLSSLILPGITEPIVHSEH